MTNFGHSIKAIREGRLLCYADDVAVICDSFDEVTQIIREFEGLELKTGLRMNKKKCEIIANEPALILYKEKFSTDEENKIFIHGVQVKRQVRYLGHVFCETW